MHWLKKIVSRSGVFLALVLVASLVAPLLSPTPVYAWSSGYTYRQSFSLSRASGAVNNYVMEVIVHKGSGASSGDEVYLNNHSEAWPNDIIFTNASDTALDYGLITNDASTARFWVEFDTIGTSATTFYVYYGKSGASYSGDLTEVGTFGDDFNRASLGAEWTAGTNTEASIESNQLKWKCSSGDSPPGGVYHSFTFDGDYSETVVFTAPDLTADGQRINFALADEAASTDHGLWVISIKNNSGTKEFQTLTTSGWTSHGTYTPGNIYRFEIKYKDSTRTATLCVDGSALKTDVAGFTAPDWSSHNSAVAFTGSSSLNMYTYWDNVLVRSWVDPEPSWGAWGSEQEMATVSTGSASNVGTDSATLNGSIDDLGSAAEATTRGFEWGTSPGTYTGDWHEDGSFSTGSFSHAVTGLSSWTTYYYRAYATTSVGTSYGSEQSFATSGTSEGNWYSDYKYRQKVYIQGGDSPLSNAVVHLTLHRGSPNDSYQAFLDALPFTRRAGNWLRPSGIPESYDKDGLEYNFVIDSPYDPNLLLMYYCPGTLEGEVHEYPAVATSIKGSDVWTKWEGNPLFEHGASIRSLSPVVYNGQIWVYYSSASPTSGAYLAISDDGFHFTEYNNGDTPVFEGGGTPFVTRFEGDDNWYMYYGSSHSGGVKVAISTDGIQWTASGTVLTSSGDANRGYFGEAKTVYKMGDTYVMLYDAFANYPHTSYPPVVMMATSSSPTGTFTPYSGNPILTGTGTEGDWDSLAVTTGALYWNEDTNKWELYYNGTDSTTFRPCAYGVAESSAIEPDGNTSYLYDHMENWPNDIRVAAPDGTTMLDYNASASGNTLDLYALIPSLPTEGTYIYIYYGKAGASDNSTTLPASTVFSDDFNRADSDTIGNDWVEEGTTDGDISSNRLKIVSNSTSIPGNDVRHTITFDQDLTITLDAVGPELVNNSGYDIYLIDEDADDHGSWGIGFKRSSTGVYSIKIQDDNVGEGWPTSVGSYSPGTTYSFKMVYDNTSRQVSFYVNDSLITVQAGASVAAWNSYQNNIIFGGVGAGGGPNTDWYIDNVEVTGPGSATADVGVWYPEESYGAPTITTTSPVVYSSSATLQGSLDDMGAQSVVYVFFEYGRTTSYELGPTEEQSLTSVGSFSADVDGLTPDAVYHYRAVARYSTNQYTYGDDVIFTTKTVTPGAPVNFGATASATEITLTWGKGTSASRTMVRYSTDTYPTSRTSGVEIYFDTGTSYTHSGLTEGVTYYYSAWSEINGVYSETYATTSAMLGAPGTLPNPNQFTVESVKVFRNYLDDGDLLFVMTNKIIMNTMPAEDIKDCVMIQLLDGSTLKAQGVPTQWGFRPASIYLASGHGLSWDAEYTIRLQGRESKWASTPSSTYDLSAGSWSGDDLNYLKDWILNAAERMEEYYGVDLVTYSPDKGQVLTVTGGEWFNEAIPGLIDKLPELFAAGVIEFEGMPEPGAPVYEGPSVEDAWGSTITGELEELGGFMNLSSDTVGAIVWSLVLLLVAGGLALMVGGEIAFIATLPLALVGVYMGLYDLSVVISIGVILVVVALFKYVVRSGA